MAQDLDKILDLALKKDPRVQRDFAAMQKKGATKADFQNYVNQYRNELAKRYSASKSQRAQKKEPGVVSIINQNQGTQPMQGYVDEMEGERNSTGVYEQERQKMISGLKKQMPNKKNAILSALISGLAQVGASAAGDSGAADKIFQQQMMNQTLRQKRGQSLSELIAKLTMPQKPTSGIQNLEYVLGLPKGSEARRLGEQMLNDPFKMALAKMLGGGR